uniref:S_100 domain-containing protein n=1 Tax=Meloidogyne hapla TaxID=6305 RepID=A0A1I8BIL8_MELHA
MDEKAFERLMKAQTEQFSQLFKEFCGNKSKVEDSVEKESADLYWKLQSLVGEFNADIETGVTFESCQKVNHGVEKAKSRITIQFSAIIVDYSGTLVVIVENRRNGSNRVNSPEVNQVRVNSSHSGPYCCTVRISKTV